MRRFELKDVEVINGWYAARGLDEIEASSLPAFGLIIDNICAGFIYQTDGGFCLLDGFVSNKEASKTERSLCLDVLTEGLIGVAEEFGYKSILAFTSQEAIKQRCERYNFSAKGGYDLFLREI